MSGKQLGLFGEPKKTEEADKEIMEQLRRYNSGEEEPPFQGGIPDTDKLQSTISENIEEWWGDTPCQECKQGENEGWEENYWTRSEREADGRLTLIPEPENYGKLPAIILINGKYLCEKHYKPQNVQPGHKLP